MARVTIVYNASSGSDTVASGAGPATAVTGSSATNGAGNVVNLDGTPDLSGVSVNDVLWVNSAAGNMHLTRITAVDDGADTVTTEVLTTLGGGVSWAIGGKRQTLINDTTQVDTLDALEGWKFELEAGTYAHTATSLTFTSTWTVGDFEAHGPIEIVAASGTSPTITWTSNASAITVSGGIVLRVEGVSFSNTVSLSGAARAISHNTSFSYLDIVNCTIVCHGDCIWSNATIYANIYGCNLKSTHVNGIWARGRSCLAVINNIIHECGADGASPGVGRGIYLDVVSGLAGSTIMGNVIRDCYAEGIELELDNPTQLTVIVNNIIHNNGNDGIFFSGTLTETNRAVVLNNILTENGGYGISVNSASGGDMCVWNDHNAFRNNTSGEVNNITKGSNSVTLTADPYTDEAGDDYTLNDTAGGGAACKNAGYGYSGP